MANDIIDIVVTDNSDNVQLNVTPNLVSINVSQTSGNIIGSNYFLASTFAALPLTGDLTTLYITNDTSLLYRWNGSTYIQVNSVTSWGTISGTLSTQTDLQNALNAKAPLASPTFTGTVSGITKSMVGLSNVDNTSDVNKPVSTATQTALDFKANIASPTFTGTVGGITKAMVGLGNVDNTTDLNKPISTATQTALNLKYDASNPSGYTTNVGTVTSVGGTGTVSGLSLSGTVTTSGNLTLGGTLSLTSGNVTTALGYTPENAANKGVANGYASLDGGGLVPSTQLPSYVDDVLEFANLAAFPASGATGKIYVALDTNKIYRWSGATYIEVSPTVGTIWGGITGTLSNQTDLQNALNAKQDDLNGTGFVKASGTTITYDNSTYYPYPTGDTTQYVGGDGSLIAFPIAGQSGTIVRLVRNNTGATLTKGTVIYISGAIGNNPVVSKAIATGDATSAQTFGLCQANIANNATGYVVVMGDLIGLDTSAFTEGQQVYLSGTVAGAFTATKQFAPIHLVYIGVITRSHPTLGQIEVKIQNGYELDEIHDVSAQTPTNNDGLFYESSSNLWKNKSITTVLGYTPYNATNPNNYIALTALSSTATGLTYTNTTGVLSLTSGYVIPTTSSATNWDTAYTNRITSLTTTGTSGAATLTGNTLNIPQYQGVLTNPVTGTGTTNAVPKWTSSSVLGNSNITDDGTSVSIGGTGNVNINNLIGGTVNRTLPTGNNFAGQTININGSANGWALLNRNWWNFNDDAFTTGGALAYDVRLFINRSAASSGTYSIYGASVINNGTGAQSGSAFNASSAGTGNFVTYNAFKVGNNGPLNNTNSYTNYFGLDISFTPLNNVSNYRGISIADFTGTNLSRGVELNLAAGTNKFNIFAGGTANNFMAGSLGIGSTSLSSNTLRISKNITGATTYSSVLQDGTILSDVTNIVRYFESFAVTQNTAFTLSNLVHYRAGANTFGAATVVNQFGFEVGSSLTGATNNYGFRGLIPAGTGRWNLFMDGTANNYLAGNLLIGSTTDAGFKLDVNGTARVSGNATFSSKVGIGASSSPTYLLEVSTAGGSERIRVGTLQNNNNNSTFEAITTSTINTASSGWFRANAGGSMAIGTSFYTKANGDSGNFANLSAEVQNTAMTIFSGGDVRLNTSGAFYSNNSTIAVAPGGTTIFTPPLASGMYLVSYVVGGNASQVGYALVGNRFGSTLFILASGAGSQTSLSVSGLNLVLSQSASGSSLSTSVSFITLNSGAGV